MEHWGTLTSLYGVLSEQQKLYLESAIKCRYRGLYAQAERIYADSLPSARSMPIVAIEHATLYERMGYEVKRASILQEPLAAIAAAEYVVSESVHRLLRILLASTEMYTHGRLRPSLGEARDLRKWLLGTDPSDYTDVMVYSVWTYHSIVKHCRTQTNWCVEDDGDLPISPAQSSYSSMTMLRTILMKQDRMHEAVQLVRDESRLGAGMQCLLPYQEILLANADCDAGQAQALFHKLLTSQIFLAEALGDLGQKEEAEEMLDEIRARLLSVCDLEPAEENPRLCVLLSMVAHDVEKHSDDHVNSEGWLRVADYAETMDERAIHRVCLRNAYATADNLVDTSSSVDTLTQAILRRDALLQKYLHFEFSVTRSAYFVASCLGSVALRMRKNFRTTEWLEYCTDFWKEWSDFDIPMLGRTMSDEEYNAANIIGDSERAEQACQKSEEFLRNCCLVSARKDGGLDFATDEDENYTLDWQEIPPGMTKATIIYVRFQWVLAKILIRWVQQDMQSVSLSVLDVQTILCLPPAQAGEDLSWVEMQKLVLHMDPQELRDRIFGLEKPRPVEQWNSWFKCCQRWLNQERQSPSVLHRHHLLKQAILSHQHDFDNTYIDAPMTTKFLVEKLERSKMTLRVLQKLDARIVYRQDIRTYMSAIATTWMLMANTAEARQAGVVDAEKLDLARVIKETLAAAYRRENSQNLLYLTLTSLSRCAWVRHKHYKDVPADQGLAYLTEADKVYRQMVSNTSTLAGFRAFSAKHHLAEEISSSELLSSAMSQSIAAWSEFLMAHSDNVKKDAEGVARTPEYQRIIQNFVMWTQRAKSRCLTDMMGLGAQFPASLVADVTASPEAMRLLGREGELEETLANAAMSEKIVIREQLDALRQEMRRVEVMGPSLDLIEGVTVTSKELMSMGSFLGEAEEVIFIDWLHIVWQDAWNLAFTLYKNGDIFNCFRVDGLLLKDVEAWVQKNLEPDPRMVDREEDLKFCPLSGRSARRLLKQLHPLVSQLENLTKPGQVLVISPTNALHRIPFHALEVGGKPLIERNPVVYCQSLTVLRLCFLSRFQLEGAASDILQPAVFNPLSNEVETAEAVSEIATLLGTTVQNSSASSKEAFVDFISQATLIHFHGHVRFDESDPLKHHLELAPLPVSSNPNVEIGLAPTQILTAQDVFETSFQKGAHLTLISCKGARAKISRSNECLGLITAFHYAGASSIISSLWNIHRDDGADFARIFYNEFVRDLLVPAKADTSATSKEFVDLARAMQKAVLAVRRDADGKVRAPYHWAGFVFNGAWLFPRIAEYELETKSNPDDERAPFSHADRRGTW